MLLISLTTPMKFLRSHGHGACTPSGSRGRGWQPRHWRESWGWDREEGTESRSGSLPHRRWATIGSAGYPDTALHSHRRWDETFWTQT